MVIAGTTKNKVTKEHILKLIEIQPWSPFYWSTIWIRIDIIFKRNILWNGLIRSEIWARMRMITGIVK